MSVQNRHQKIRLLLECLFRTDITEQTSNIKVLSGYTKYYNTRYKRTGPLFESRFKDKLIDSDEYFEHLVGYIWNNPIKIIRPEYKSIDLYYGKINLTKTEEDFATNYPYKYFPKNYQGPNHKVKNNLKFENLDF